MFKKMINFIFFGMLITLSFNSVSRTVLIGDSLMGTIGPNYIQEFGENNKYYFKVSSGLINKKIYNWFEKVKEIDFHNYNEVIINIGTNDFLPISGSQVGSDNWQQKYTKLQQELISNIKLKNPRIKITWISPPALENTFKNKEVAKVRDLINLNSYILGYDYFDVRDVLGNDFKLYKNGKQIRAKDGIHYTHYAGKLIVNELDNI